MKIQNILKYQVSFSLFFLLFLSSSCLRGHLGKKRSVEYRNGMVVTAHAQASEVGIEILKKGGNAIDAAVAVQFALAVVYPNAGNIGGGGFLVYRSNAGETASLDFREKAPAHATRDMYLDASGIPEIGKSTSGHLASGVPGSVDGMVKAHQRYGRLKWAELVQPSIDLARNGFRISEMQAQELNISQEDFKKHNAGKDYFINADFSAGDIIFQPDLARTLELIRDKGREGFYGGLVADQIAAEMKAGGGLITRKDLRDYQAVWRDPIIANYKGYKIITMPPPSSGGIALIQLLKSVEPYDLKKWGHNSDSVVQLVVEAERRVYADRAAHLGDPDFYRVPQQKLLEYDYSHRRMNDFNWNKATLSSQIQAGNITVHESAETTHFSIVDRHGNAVSVTTTLNGSFGSKVFVAGAGFLLNNEMDDFSIKPGVPNMYGLVGGEANAISPGKRMLSSMTPTILEKDGDLFMVVGSPGGSTIITSVFQTILNVTAFGKPMQQAVNAKRFHHQWLPDEIRCEQGALDSLSQVLLKNKGYSIREGGNMGRVDAILKTEWGYYQGGADPRGDDVAIGW